MIFSLLCNLISGIYPTNGILRKVKVNYLGQGHIQMLSSTPPKMDQLTSGGPALKVCTIPHHGAHGACLIQNLEFCVNGHLALILISIGSKTSCMTPTLGLIWPQPWCSHTDQTHLEIYCTSIPLCTLQFCNTVSRSGLNFTSKFIRIEVALHWKALRRSSAEFSLLRIPQLWMLHWSFDDMDLEHGAFECETHEMSIRIASSCISVYRNIPKNVTFNICKTICTFHWSLFTLWGALILPSCSQSSILHT